MKKEISKEFTNAQQEVLNSVRLSRVILPILLGIGVVGYLLWQQYDPDDFKKINWTAHTTFWVAASCVLLIVRHLAYAVRLRILSEGQFSWRKCIELIFIWEFSSAVSPTSVGGSAVALFVLSQEKLSTAKTATIVVYSAVLDTIFFISTLPILLLLLGTEIIRPNMQSFNDLDGWGYTFIGAYFFMAIYGGLFFYGLFINPNTIKRVLVGCTRWGFLRRFRHQSIELGNDIIIASKELQRKRWPFHIGAFLGTAGAWSCRFLLLNCLFIAFAPDISMGFLDQFRLYARLETMFVVMAFSPTPGGAGFAEFAFFGFTSDYISEQGIALLIAAIWRLLTYYAYLLVGAIIIPNWIRQVLNRRKRKKMQASENR
ncbi:MAG: lysylphosphatidylglycerol synthase transmembrane domain-containing protein [Bacteroidota bacterium]